LGFIPENQRVFAVLPEPELCVQTNLFQDVHDIIFFFVDLFGVFLQRNLLIIQFLREQAISFVEGHLKQRLL